MAAIRPLVSIIIPTYNRASLLAKVLDAIKTQTYTNWECILVDDGSTDTTEQLVTSFVEKDSRFQFYKRPDNLPKGANACRNYGFKKSKGDYINWFDSDDYMLPQKLELQLLQLQKAKTPFCICQTERYDAVQQVSLGLRAPKIISKDSLNDYVQFQIFWTTGAALWDRSFIEKYNLVWNETLQQSQDYDFHMNALAITTKYATIDTVLMQLVRHEHNMSNAIMDKHDKIISNVEARYLALKNHHQLLSVASQKELLYRMYYFFRKTTLTGSWTTSKRTLQLLQKSSVYLSDECKLTNKVLFRWKLAFWSFRLLGKGEKLLKFPK